MGVSAGPQRIAHPADDTLAALAFREARGVDPFEPFVPLLHHPELLRRVEELGRVIRHEGGLADQTREAAILVTAAAWAQPIEWAIHAPEAVHAGIGPSVIAAIDDGGPPRDASADVAATIAFTRELHSTRQVGDATFTEAHALLGTAGVLELTVLSGYYALIAMVMNVAGTTLQEGGIGATGEG